MVDTRANAGHFEHTMIVVNHLVRMMVHPKGECLGRFKPCIGYRKGYFGYSWLFS